MRRLLLGTFLAGVALTAWLVETPPVYLEAEPAPFAIEPAGAHRTRVSFDPARELKDFVVQFEIDGDAAGRVELHLNGRCVTHVRMGSKEKCTARVPRLFLKAGANEIEVRNPAAQRIAMKPLVFPSHRAAVARPPEGAPILPVPEVWGQPEYRWEKGEVALWVAVQGEGKQFLADAEVVAHRAGRPFPMTKIVRGEIPVRYEAAWPIDAAGPTRVTVRAKGYAEAESWFPLRRPGATPALRETAVRVPFQLAPPSPRLEFAFRVFLPEGLEAPPAGLVDYDGLMAWISSVRGRGGAVYLDRDGTDLRARFGDFVYLTEADGIVARDGKGWDPAVDPGGFWDRMLHQRQRVDLLGPAGPGAMVVSDPGWTLEVDLAGAGPGGIASLVFGESAPLRIRATAPSRITKVEWISDTPAQASWSSVPVSHAVQATRPGYGRVAATAEDGTRAITAPIWIEVRPGARDRVVHREAGAFTPPADGFYVVEVGVDPGEGKKLEVTLDGKVVGAYRAANTIHGQGIRHVVPFRAGLGRLEKGKPVAIGLAGDGVRAAYTYVLRTALPALAMTDLHSHSKITEDFSNELHRTMGYDLIMTAHGGFGSRDARKKALERARELSDDGMMILIGGERGDHFGACHVSLGFITQELDAWDARDQKYSSAIALAADWGGVACLNHPSEDSRLGWMRKHYQWGYADPHYHGFAGWAHKEHHYGAGDHYWRLVTIVEYFNGYGAPSIAAGKNEGGYGPRMRWHEEIGRHVRGERRAPLFAVGNTDTKTFQQEDQERLRIGSMYAATMVHAADREPASIGASLMAGNSIAACHADTRMVVSVEDAEGRFYHPGNHLLGKGPFKVSVEAWAPRDLALVRLVGPRGTLTEKPVKGRHVLEEFTLEGLGAWDWFLVELRGDEPRTAAVSNPFLK